MNDPRALLNEHLAKGVPHNRALGITVEGLSRSPAKGKDGAGETGEATMRLPYRSEFVGNPQTGVLHGGVITSLMDACCGAAVYVRIARPVPIATLDLRIDYLKPATPGQDVIAHATCYKATKNVAFVRCLAYHEAEDDPIAHAAATFMLSTK